MTIDKDLINPFVLAAIEVIQELEGEKPTRGQISLKTNSVMAQEVATIIGITGNLEGRLILDISKDTACKLAEALLKESFAEFNEIVESAMGEVANLITGRAVSVLNELGYRIKITPPTLFSGKNLTVSDRKMKMLIIPLDCKSGKIFLNIALKVAE